MSRSLPHSANCWLSCSWHYDVGYDAIACHFSTCCAAQGASSGMPDGVRFIGGVLKRGAL